MHNGTCVTQVPWCMSRSLTHGGGQNVPGIPGACATHNFTYLVRGPRGRMTDLILYLDLLNECTELPHVNIMTTHLLQAGSSKIWSIIISCILGPVYISVYTKNIILAIKRIGIYVCIICMLCYHILYVHLSVLDIGENEFYKAVYIAFLIIIRNLSVQWLVIVCKTLFVLCLGHRRNC